jgi:RNA-directed DNA polymerase
MLQKRVVDGSMDRLIAKCLHVGVLDGEEFSTPDTGTGQGSILSPLLGNIYLHFVLDEWWSRDVQPRLCGRACLVRYADDFVLCFEHQEDAERVREVLPQRLGRYGLTLHPDKTRLLDFRSPPVGQQGGKGPATFDFLGFTLHWRRTRRGRWRLGCKTRRARLGRAIRTVYAWCRSHRHEAVKVQHAALCSRLRGHYHYFGVQGNLRSLACLEFHARYAWYTWLRRRSQRTRLNLARFRDLLRSFPLPRPRIVVPLWGRPP